MVATTHSVDSGAFVSLVDRLRVHARATPDKTALIFLPDGETELGRLTYAELDLRVRAFAARLQGLGLQGQSVLLMLPSSIQYVVAFLGSLYAGAVPVPAYPPTSSLHAERLSQMVQDCDAKSVILTSSGSQQERSDSKLQRFFPQGLPCELLTLGDLPALGADDWVAPVLTGERLAYLQYTSGSTRQPRGVMVSHGNLMAHAQHFASALEQSAQDTCVSWLPLFHDMGLIGGLLQPLYLGATAVLMPPLAFLQQPLRWLGAISRYRGVFSFAPNFAYELCAASLHQAQIDTLDLSSWAIALNGAEPVRASTLAAFVRRFGPRGFASQAMHPSYGMAENTLAVTLHRRGVAPTVYTVEAAALAQDRLVLAGADSAQTRALVGCGSVRDAVVVRVVSVATGQLCADGQVGEIWLRSALTAQGYWRCPEQTAQVFGAYLPDGQGPFLRTGDLGALYEGQLFITGRLKDLIIIRGTNHYPQDVEYTAFSSHPALEVGHGAAFAVEVGEEEKLVIVQEVRRTWRKRLDRAQAVQAIRAAVSEHHGLQPHAVVLVKPGSVRLTSSGKIQRQASKNLYLQNALDPLFMWTAALSGSGVVAPGDGGALAVWLQQWIAKHAQVAAQDVDMQRAFNTLGLDSLALGLLAGDLSAYLKRPVEPTLLYNFPSIEMLVQHLLGVSQDVVHPSFSKVDDDEVVMVGMACRLPGAPSLQDFWALLQAGGDAITEVPAGRWDVDALYQKGASQAGKMNTRWGGFLEEVDAFDAAFFGIAPIEADQMDPQQRVLLQTMWHALEHAGLPIERLAGSATGVFMGVSSQDFRQVLADCGAEQGPYVGTGTSPSVLASRFSYLFDLRGPSWAVDTACSSSLVAVHQARRSLLDGECDVALAGAVNLILTPTNTVIFSQAQMMSQDGRCKAFDASADGYVRSEGSAVVVLKRYRDALRDGDRIWAVLPGSAVNQDGKSNGLTAPNGVAQEAVMRQALRSARMQPSEVSLLEAHGTGTRLGDPIEASAIRAVYGEPTADQAPLWVGSAKANVGHLEAAAGMAGLIKVVLAMAHRQVPAQVHFESLNPGIDWVGSRCAVARGLQPWARGGDAPLVAGVSSFGFGGTNAHVLVRQAPRAQATRLDEEDQAQVLLLSAKTPSALEALVGLTLQCLEAGVCWAALCRSLALRRTHHEERLALVVASKEEAVLALRGGQGVLRGRRSAVAGAPMPVHDGVSLHDLAAHHVRGGVVDWAARWPGVAPVVDLPLYPFARERHGPVPGPTKLAPVSVRNELLHPLLGRRLPLAGPQAAQYFENQLACDAPGFVGQHRIGGRAVLPGTAMLEWLLAAAQSRGPWALSGVVFEHMLVLPPEQVVTVQLVRAQAQVQCFSWAPASSAAQGWQAHVQALIAQGVSAPPVKAHLLATLKAQLPAQKPAALYAQFESLGMAYGPCFRGVQAWWRDETQALVHVVVPPLDDGRYLIHPVCLDACLHPVLGWLGQASAAVVPVGVQAVQVYRALPCEVFAHVHWRGSPSAGRYVVDVDVYSPQGESLVSLVGVQLQALAVAVDQPAAVPTQALLTHAQMPALLALPIEVGKAQLLQDLLRRVAATLALEGEALALTQAEFADVRLNSLGLDSISAVDLRNQFASDLQVDVSVEHFVNGATGYEVVQLIYNQWLLKKLVRGSAHGDSTNLDDTEVLVI